jgi:hypothetical protein
MVLIVSTLKVPGIQEGDGRQILKKEGVENRKVNMTAM